jgi:hypothetical protein
MFRAIALCLLAAGATAGCADTHPVTSGGYYCKRGTTTPCPSHEVYGDCQACPSASVSSAR